MWESSNSIIQDASRWTMKNDSLATYLFSTFWNWLGKKINKTKRKTIFLSASFFVYGSVSVCFVCVFFFWFLCISCNMCAYFVLYDARSRQRIKVKMRTYGKAALETIPMFEMFFFSLLSFVVFSWHDFVFHLFRFALKKTVFFSFFLLNIYFAFMYMT